MVKPVSDKIKLALFDIDGTIFRSSLLIELINGLEDRKIFPPAAIKEVEKEYLAWLNRKGSYDNYIWKVIKIHLKYLNGKSYGPVKETARMVIKKMKDRVYRYTRDLIADLKTQDYYLVAISGSPKYIVEEFSKKWGFDAHFGTPYEVVKGKFTGKTFNTDSFNNKVKIVNSLIEKFNGQVDLKESVAVGDTEGDISMLEMVGRPIAMNPNTVLARHAKSKKWRIIVERKDVIYRINDFEFLNRDI